MISGETLRSGSILVVDDDVRLCQTIVDTLEEKGYNATFAQTAEEGLRRATLDPPELILLDLEIPKMGGFVLCQKLRNHAKTERVPIVFVTVRDSDFDKQTAMSLGADRYITKPFRKSHLLKEIEELIVNSKSDRKEWVGSSSERIQRVWPSAPAPVVGQIAPPVPKLQTSVSQQSSVKSAVPQVSSQGKREDQTERFQTFESFRRGAKVSVGEKNRGWIVSRKIFFIVIAFILVGGLLWCVMALYKKGSEYKGKIKEENRGISQQ